MMIGARVICFSRAKKQEFICSSMSKRGMAKQVKSCTYWCDYNMGIHDDQHEHSFEGMHGFGENFLLLNCDKSYLWV